jgi:threonine dehydrogenase-like Zn-dependent dehydrogenase
MAKAAFMHGASIVLVTDPVPARLRLAEAQGAEQVAGDDPAASVLEATDGEGADVVIDAAGYEPTWAMGLRAVRTGGRIEEVGLGAGSGTVDFFAVLGKEVTLTGSYAWGDADFARAVEMVARDTLDPSGWFTSMPIEEGQRAFQELVDGAGLFKVVLEF